MAQGTPNFRTYARSFAGGELTPEFYGQLTDVKFQTGLALCRNFRILPHGPAQNRPGTQFVRKVKFPNKKTRVISFTFSTTQTFAIELGTGYFRFHTQGASLLPGSPAAYNGATAYSVGALVSSGGVNYYAIQASTGVSLGNTAFWYPLPDVVYEIPNPYAEADLFDIHFVQEQDVLTLVHPNYPPLELRRLGATQWVLAPIQFVSLLNPPLTVAAAAGVGSGTTAYSYLVTSVDSTGNEESLSSASATVTNNLLTSGNYNTITWASSPSAYRYNVYKQSNGLYGYIGQTDGLTYKDDNITADIGTTPPQRSNPFTPGSISNISVTNGGAGFTTGAVYITTSTGSGFLGTLNISGGVVTSVNIINGGTNYASSDTVIIAGGTGSAQASGTTTFTVQPAVNSSINLNGVVWGFTAAAGAFQTVRGANLAATLTQLAIDLNASTDSRINVATYVATATQLQISYDNPGTPGNAYTLGIGSAASSVSGATLTGGLNGTATANLITNPLVGLYPGAVTYFDQRRDFAGTSNNPQTLYMTRVGTESNLSYSLPTRDDDAITVKVAAREANTIRHLIPLTSLVLLTSAAEWEVTSVNSDAITPTSISVKPRSYIGASNVQPVIVNSNVLYAAARGGHLRELTYPLNGSTTFITGDISIRAPHLFDNLSINDMAYAKAPYPIVHMPSSSGNLVNLTYLPEQQIGALYRYDTYTKAGQSLFESCCVVAEGAEDAVYTVVNRVINGVQTRYIERFASRNFVTPADAYFVDCGATVTSGTPFTTISGLTWLEGESVSLLVDGAVQPRKVVTGGVVTLDDPGLKVQIGLPITADLQLLPLSLEIMGYAQGRQKNVNKVWLRVFGSSGIFAGPDFDNLTEAKQRTNEPYGKPPALNSREVPIDVKGAWTDSAQICIRQVDPLPLTAVSLSMEVALGG